MSEAKELAQRYSLHDEPRPSPDTQEDENVILPIEGASEPHAEEARAHLGEPTTAEKPIVESTCPDDAPQQIESQPSRMGKEADLPPEPQELAVTDEQPTRPKAAPVPARKEVPAASPPKTSRHPKTQAQSEVRSESPSLSRTEAAKSAAKSPKSGQGIKESKAPSNEARNITSKAAAANTSAKAVPSPRDKPPVAGKTSAPPKAATKPPPPIFWKEPRKGSKRDALKRSADKVSTLTRSGSLRQPSRDKPIATQPPNAVRDQGKATIPAQDNKTASGERPKEKLPTKQGERSTDRPTPEDAVLRDQRDGGSKSRPKDVAPDSDRPSKVERKPLPKAADRQELQTETKQRKEAEHIDSQEPKSAKQPESDVKAETKTEPRQVRTQHKPDHSVDEITPVATRKDKGDAIRNEPKMPHSAVPKHQETLPRSVVAISEPNQKEAVSSSGKGRSSDGAQTSANGIARKPSRIEKSNTADIVTKSDLSVARATSKKEASPKTEPNVSRASELDSTSQKEQEKNGVTHPKRTDSLRIRVARDSMTSHASDPNRPTERSQPQAAPKSAPLKKSSSPPGNRPPQKGPASNNRPTAAVGAARTPATPQPSSKRRFFGLFSRKSSSPAQQSPASLPSKTSTPIRSTPPSSAVRAVPKANPSNAVNTKASTPAPAQKRSDQPKSAQAPSKDRAAPESGSYTPSSPLGNVDDSVSASPVSSAPSALRKEYLIVREQHRSHTPPLQHEHPAPPPVPTYKPLDVNIPDVSMERYSVMFSNVLKPRRTSLMARRQAQLERLKVPELPDINELNNGLEIGGEKHPALRRPRGNTMASPKVSPTRLLPLGDMILSSQVCGLHRSNTVPAQSPTRFDFNFDFLKPLAPDTHLRLDFSSPSQSSGSHESMRERWNSDASPTSTEASVLDDVDLPNGSLSASKKSHASSKTDSRATGSGRVSAQPPQIPKFILFNAHPSSPSESPMTDVRGQPPVRPRQSMLGARPKSRVFKSTKHSARTNATLHALPKSSVGLNGSPPKQRQPLYFPGGVSEGARASRPTSPSKFFTPSEETIAPAQALADGGDPFLPDMSGKTAPFVEAKSDVQAQPTIPAEPRTPTAGAHPVPDSARDIPLPPSASLADDHERVVSTLSTQSQFDTQPSAPASPPAEISLARKISVSRRPQVLTGLPPAQTATQPLQAVIVHPETDVKLCEIVGSRSDCSDTSISSSTTSRRARRPRRQSEHAVLAYI